MSKRIFLLALVCLFALSFGVAAAYAAPMVSGESVVESKYVMSAADKFLKMSPDMGYYRFDVKDLKMKVDSNSMDFVIIDVRPSKAFADEHIAMAQNIPLPTLIDKLSMVPMDKTVYVVCALDSNSSYATAVLRMLGYNAYMVPGGEGAWKSMGYPLVMGM